MANAEFFKKYAPAEPGATSGGGSAGSIASPAAASPYDSFYSKYSPSPSSASPTGQSLSQTPPEYSGWDRPLSLLRNSVVNGVAGLSGVLHGLDTVANWSPIAAVLGEPQRESELPTKFEAMDKLASAGAYSHREVNPTGPVENTIDAGVQGATTGLPLALLAGGAGPAAVATGLAAFGGMLGRAAPAIFPDNSIAQSALPVLTALVPTGGVLAGADALAARSATKAAQKVAEQAGTRLENAAEGLTLARQAARTTADSSAATRNDLATTAASLADKHDQIIAESARLRDAAVETGRTQAALARTASDTALAHVGGPATTLEEGGGKAQAALENWKEAPVEAPGFRQEHEKAWAPVDARMNPTQTVQIGNYRQVLTDLTGNAGGLQSSAETILPAAKRAKELLDRLGTDADLTPAQLQRATPQVTWQDLKSYRSLIGDALGDPKLTRDFSEDQLAKIYSALTKDMQQATLHGPLDLSAEFAAATSRSKELFDFAQGPMRKLLPAPSDSAVARSGGEAAKSVLRAAQTDGSTLAAIRQFVPEAADALRNTALRAEDYQPWTKLSPTAKAALVPEDDARALADAAHETRGQADLHEKLTEKMANSAHEQTKAEAAEQAQAFRRIQQSASRLADSQRLAVGQTVDVAEQEKLAAAAAAKRAEAALPPSASGPRSAASKLGSKINERIGATVIGGALGQSLEGVLPGANYITGGLVGAGLDTVLPAIGRGVAAVPRALGRRSDMTGLLTAGALGQEMPEQKRR